MNIKKLCKINFVFLLLFFVLFLTACDYQEASKHAEPTQHTLSHMVDDERPLCVLAKREVLILMYHDFRPEAVYGNDAIISVETFRNQIYTLYNAGFETITFDELIAFVDYGKPLPEKPIIITIDDGYRSNLEFAAPILYEFGMRAIINVIGISRGRDTYRNTDIPIIPHFTWDEVRPWVELGVIQIGHHSYDMHRWHRNPYESWRYGVLPTEYETELGHRQALEYDFKKLYNIIYEELGISSIVFAYPYGHYSPQTESILQELGVRVTLTTHSTTAIVEYGNPASLFLLGRVNMSEYTNFDTLFAMLDLHAS